MKKHWRFLVLLILPAGMLIAGSVLSFSGVFLPWQTNAAIVQPSNGNDYTPARYIASHSGIISEENEEAPDGTRPDGSGGAPPAAPAPSPEETPAPGPSEGGGDDDGPPLPPTEESDPEPCEPDIIESTDVIGPFDCDFTNVYRCENNSCGTDGGAIQQATQYYQCIETTVSWTDIGCGGSGSSSVTERIDGPFYKDFRQHSTAGDYQICPATANDWSPFVPSYQCSGQCYPAPEVKELTDKDLAPKNVFDNSKKPKLPVNVGWKDNVEVEVATESCQVESYKWRVLGTSSQGETESAEERSAVADPECKLSPNSQNTFAVSACAAGTCGEEGELTFQTSSAPQPRLPYDPDWELEVDSAFSPIPVTLEWCPAAGVNSWRMKLYEEKDIPLEEDLVKEVILTHTFAKDKTTYPDAQLWRAIEKNIKYFWEIFPCTDQLGQDCSDIGSQFWSVLPSETPLATPVLSEPQNGAVTNKQSQFTWFGDGFTHRFVLRVEKEQKTPGDPFGIVRYYPRTPRFSFNSLFGWENNKTYKWKVAACWGTLDNTTGLSEAQIEEELKKICETTETEELAWSEERSFTTTGAAPTNLGIKKEGRDDATNAVSVPLLLDWDDMAGALSYVYEVATDSSFSTDTIVIPPQERIVQRSEVSPGQPNITSNTKYWVRVKTCADHRGEVCGPWSQIQVVTANLAPQQISTPQEGKGPFLSVAISAPEVFGAKAYNYFIKYFKAEDDEIADCKEQVGEEKEGIAHSSNFQVEAKCTGEYQARVRACLDKECKVVGDWSNTILVPVIECPGPNFGLVPCGLCRDFKNTPINERNSCQVDHLFLMVRNIVDFALWKITLIVVVLMAAATGAVLFFSFGGPDTIVKVKRMWKAIGIGVLLLLFSWILLNILLGVVGFNIGPFGNWYEVKF